jgi:hypothetical protein
MPEYALAPHVRFCECDEGILFLDLKKNRYLGVGKEHLGALRSLLQGCVSGSCSDSAEECTQNNGTDSLANTLLEQGLLVKGVSPLRPSAPAIRGAKKAIDCGWSTESAPALSFDHCYTFLLAILNASFQLKFLCIDRIIRNLQNSTDPISVAYTEFDESTVVDLILIFGRLTPWTYTAKDACLFDSLALVRFLRSHHVNATWTIGVTARPFAAHCWVQYGDLVLNDTLEHVQCFTPILVV